MISRLDNAIEYSFYALFFFVPLILYPKTYELFEFNKMVFVYLITSIILTLWLLKMILEKKIVLKKTPFDWPIFLFLGANILSTVFSIDQHVSFFGYYSRFNGGLLSTVCYLILFYALVSNLKRAEVLKIIYVIIASTTLVSIWGVLEHWGIDADYWAEEVKQRVFSTLGQANWLAAFLAMVIPLNLALILGSANLRVKISNLILLLVNFMAFTFTYSRGGTIGLIASLAFFLLALAILARRERGWLKDHSAWLGTIFSVFLVVFLIWGNAFQKESLLTKLFEKRSTSTPQEIAPSTPQAPSGTQLEGGGTESGHIRLIVWRGALEIFRHFPLFGTGVETFAYSYPRFRPAEHNLTSEWDYVYNKAHNEYLNYLATTGLFGIFTYLFLILRYLIFSFSSLIKIKSEKLLELALLSGIVSYLVQNFFLFSVVPLSLLFYLTPALHLLLSNQNLKELQISFPNWMKNFYPTFKYSLSLLVISIFLFQLSSLGRYWFSDLSFNRGFRNDGYSSYENLKRAVSLNPIEPFYRAELGYSSASLATLVESQEDQELLISEAVIESQKAVLASPNNQGFWKTLVTTYNALSSIDDKYLSSAIEAAEKVSKLSPTDAKLHYNLAVLYTRAGLLDKASKTLDYVVKLKNDYREAHLLLAKVYYSQGDKEKAINKLQDLLKQFTDYREAHEKLAEWLGN